MDIKIVCVCVCVYLFITNKSPPTTRYSPRTKKILEQGRANKLKFTLGLSDVGFSFLFLPTNSQESSSQYISILNPWLPMATFQQHHDFHTILYVEGKSSHTSPTCFYDELLVCGNQLHVKDLGSKLCWFQDPTITKLTFTSWGD